MFSLKNLEKRARDRKKTIVLTESTTSDRVLEATKIILKKQIANVVLLGEPEFFATKAKFVKGATIIDYKNSPLAEDFADKLATIRKNKGLTIDMARELIKDEFYFATMLVYEGYADCMLGGTMSSTASVLRPALQIIKTKENIKTASSCFMFVGAKKLGFGENNLLFASDCALNKNPSSEELKDIVLATCCTAKDIGEITPKVAMLSYSSFGSGGEDESINKIRDAITLVKKEDENILIDGEMQLDTALMPEVAKVKAKDSLVAGRANVLIFPDLTSGNIGYKLIQRFGKLKAIGVIMQGLNKPVNDLSRGASVEDIVTMTALSTLQCE